MTTDSSERIKQLHTLIDLSALINSSFDIVEIKKKTIEAAIKLVNAEAGSMLLIDTDTGELYFEVALGEKGEFVKHMRLKRGLGIVGWVAEHEKPVITNDAYNDPRFFKDVDKKSHYITKNLLCVPVKTKERLVGVLELINKNNDEFNNEDLELLIVISNIMAIAIENARLYDKLRGTLYKQRDKFISVLIHDLKGPLIPIIGYSKRLIEGKAKSKEDIIRVLRIIQESSQDILQTIENTSISLKEKATLQSFNCKELEFNDILNSVILHSIPEMEKSGLEIFINDASREEGNEMKKIIIKADPYQLKTLVENLLGNAIRYAKSTIKVELSKCESNIRFVVSDDGAGIPKKYHEKIFEEYFQVPGSKKGTGLGLFSVKKVVENHNGIIAVNSTPDTGTSFEIKFPC
jgi:signal transduction histidine kinase